MSNDSHPVAGGRSRRIRVRVAARSPSLNGHRTLMGWCVPGLRGDCRPSTCATGMATLPRLDVTPPIELFEAVAVACGISAGAD